MALRKFAIVKKDPPETNSTGGIVVKISNWPENASERVGSVYDLSTQRFYNPSYKYELIPCGDDVKEGWIYTDKTNIFVDSNVSSN